jgi:C1A family cysteine protease/predicted secreted protein
MKLFGIHVNKHPSVKLFLSVVMLLTLLPFANAIAAPPSDDPDHGEVRLSAQDDSRQIELHEGQVLVISLESNPSTGYLWEVEEADDRILRQTGKIEYEQCPEPIEGPQLPHYPSSILHSTRLLGAPSKQILRFEAVAAGQTDLRLVYHRPWEKDIKPARTFSLQVQGVGPFTQAKSPTPAPAAGPSILHPPSPILHSPLGLPVAYNWCDQGGCTPVKDQGSCGSCWAFGTVGPLESNIKTQDGIEEDLSEQYLVSCNTDGWSCNGGWWAHDYHWNKPSESDAGAVYEADFRYVARDDSCKPSLTHHEKIDSWTYVGSEYSLPSVAAIKQAIYDHGPVSVAVCVGSAFQNYNGGVFETDEAASCPWDANHAVVLVGWDDNQGIWYLRNSWGSGWGESGYMRIKYGISNVGYSANYIVYSGDGGGSGQDAYEPDDTFDDASSITVNGAAQHHTFHENGDVDWAQFAVTAGSAYTITTSNLDANNDTVLDLYDTDGTTELVSNDNCPGSGLASCINNWSAPNTGTYFIKVRRYLNGAGGGNVKVYLPVIMKSGSSSIRTGYEYDLAVVDSITCNDTQVVQNGGFESGDTIWVQSSGPYDIIRQDYPRSGSWSAWFGGYNNADDRLYQTINIPASFSSAQLVFYLHVETLDSPFVPYDYFHMELQDASGGTLESFLWADNRMSSTGWYKGTKNWSDFSSHAGQTRRLFLQGTTDFSGHTNFFVDDVTLWTYCGELPAEANEDIGSYGWIWEKVETPPGYIPDAYNENVLRKLGNE